MFHLTLFSAAEARLVPAGNTCLTLFGSTALRAPTVAQRVTRLAGLQQRTPSRWDRLLGRNQVLLLTLFGYTEIALPTLVDEYAALRELAARPDVPHDRLRALCETLRAHENCGLDMATFTLFGHCHVGRPSPKRELSAIERARKGGLDGQTCTALERLVGLGEPAIIGGLAHAALG